MKNIVDFKVDFNDAKIMAVRGFDCGYCGRYVSSERGWIGFYRYKNYRYGDMEEKVVVALCPNCGRPNYFDLDGEQVPGPLYGKKVDLGDNDIEKLYNEARNAYSAGSYTACAMCCRKLLMNIAIQKGAEEGRRFVEYVDYLKKEGYLVRGSDGWVDYLRKKGNDANHEIRMVVKEEAGLLIDFVEMLLNQIFVFPYKVPQEAEGESATEQED